MSSKKRSVTFKDELLDATNELGSAMHCQRLDTIHGGESKTVNFGVPFARSALKEIAKVTQWLNDRDFDLAVASIKSLRKALTEEKKLAELEKEGVKVTQNKSDK